MPIPTLAITLGDPAGVGPEIACKALAEPALHALCQPVVIGSRAIIERVATRLHLPLPPEIIDTPVPGVDPLAIAPGKVSADAGRLAAAAIEHAIAGTREGRYAAMVTCPINKAAIHAAGIPFPGHTEWLAERCGVAGETMLMWHQDLAVVLATCHQSLASVPQTLTPMRIVESARLLAAALRRLRGRPPKLAVLGLNPHAGEGGLFGDEDRRIVVPAVYELLQLGIDCDGPLPPDTAFTPANRQKYDGHVAMYHDQALGPFKALYFDTGVNVTLGLPIIRTSVDHGTAFDIAWQGIAQHRSLVEAISLAARLSAETPTAK